MRKKNLLGNLIANISRLDFPVKIESFAISNPILFHPNSVYLLQVLEPP